MSLSNQQIQQFDNEGFLFLPNLFSAEEIAVLHNQAEANRAAGRIAVALPIYADTLRIQRVRRGPKHHPKLRATPRRRRSKTKGTTSNRPTWSTDFLSGVNRSGKPGRMRCVNCCRSTCDLLVLQPPLDISAAW